MLKINRAEFLQSATSAHEYPPTSESEFAFFGRSNSGKSSLINYLLNKRSLVKTGATPGKTKTVNFFLVEASNVAAEKEKKVSFILTDLPGYGYAKGSKEKVKTFDAMLYEYCTNRKNLKKIFLLMDIRREMSDIEIKTIQFFYKLNIEAVLVATKADKIAKTKIEGRMREIEKDFASEHVALIATSTLKNYGREEVLSSIEKHL